MSYDRRDLAEFLAVFVFALTLIYYSLSFWQNKASWDPCAYEMTGARLLGANTYFEALRAPIPSLLYKFFGLYGYFIFSWLFLAASVVVFARRMRLSPLILFLLLVPPSAAVWYVVGGSEIVALAFLFLGAAFSDSLLSAFFFALTVLARYVFAPFVLFFVPWRRFRDVRFALLYVTVFIAPLLLWSVWQWVVYGNPIASYADFLYVNSYENGHRVPIPLPAMLLKSVWPSVVVGLPFLDGRSVVFAAVVLLLAAYAGIQRPRFYLPFTIPFAVSAARRLPRDLGFLMLLVWIPATLYTLHFYSWSGAVYHQMASVADGCAVVSNVWVPLVCLGVHAVAPPLDLNSFLALVRSGWLGVMEKDVPYPPYTVDENAFRALGLPVRDYGRFFVVGNGCVHEDNWPLHPDPWNYYWRRLFIALGVAR